MFRLCRSLWFWCCKGVKTHTKRVEIKPADAPVRKTSLHHWSRCFVLPTLTSGQAAWKRASGHMDNFTAGSERLRGALLNLHTQTLYTGTMSVMHLDGPVYNYRLGIAGTFLMDNWQHDYTAETQISQTVPQHRERTQLQQGSHDLP